MKKKIVGLFIAAVVVVNFIAPPAAHAGSKTIRLRSVVKSSLSKTEQNSIASGKITLTTNDAPIRNFCWRTKAADAWLRRAAMRGFW